jgi:hypothetical protein
MNAPFIDFIRRFRELERENAAKTQSSPPDAMVLRARSTAVYGQPSVEASGSSQGNPRDSR